MHNNASTKITSRGQFWDANKLWYRFFQDFMIFFLPPLYMCEAFDYDGIFCCILSECPEVGFVFCSLWITITICDYQLEEVDSYKDESDRDIFIVDAWRALIAKHVSQCLNVSIKLIVVTFIWVDLLHVYNRGTAVT